MPQIVPEFPSKLEAGERVYPIRFSTFRLDSARSGEVPRDPRTAAVSSVSPPRPSTPHSDDTVVEDPNSSASEPLPTEPATTGEGLLVSESHEYAVVGNGEHGIVYGSRKEFRRCEDEPIHIPGAIQSFGILIAIEFVTRDKLEVRIASENCEAFCGYSPAALFALDNFLDIFPEPYRSSFAAKAWYIQEQYRRTKLRVEPSVFSTVLQSAEGSPQPLSCGIHFSGEDQTLLICEFEAHTTLEPRTAEMDPDLPEAPVVTLGVPPPLPHQTTKARPLHLHRLVQSLHPDDRSTTETVSIIAQIQQVLSMCQDVEELLDTVVKVVQKLTRFHRVMVYRFDEKYNGQVVAEAIDPQATGDAYKGLYFPASDIPPQARRLYQINKVRLLFDREMPTARLVCRSAKDMATPLDLTHSYLRAMSPIHIKYLGNMGVRSTASISLEFNNDLWGLICCHSYGPTATHVSFAVREVCYWMGLCVSNCIEKLSYRTQLTARALLETMQPDQTPQNCITASSTDILRLFNANAGFMVIQGEARTIGRHDSYLEAILVLRYVHQQGFTNILATQNIAKDLPNFPRPMGLKTIAGFLFVPLSIESDYLLFFRNHHIEEVHWAGNPHAKNVAEDDGAVLEPRASFKKWTEIVTGTCKAWTQDEYQDYANTVKLVYGKFIEVWRANERTVQNTKMKRILLLNASHEARTPLNAIINYLELALENKLDDDTKELLRKSHAASQSLVYIIDDLLNLTRSHDGSFPLLELGFDIRAAMTEALKPLEHHATKKGLKFNIHIDRKFPQFVRGDFQRFQQTIVHVVSNAIRCTAIGHVILEANLVDENESHCLVEIIVRDTGLGIEEHHLDELFQELEQIPAENTELADIAVIGRLSRVPTPAAKPTLGLGLATAARFTRLRNGQLKMKSKRGEGTTVLLTLPFPRSSEAFHPFQLPTPPEEGSAHSSLQSVLAEYSVSRVSGTAYLDGFFKAPAPEAKIHTPPPTAAANLTPSTDPTPANDLAEVIQKQMTIIVADDNMINLQILRRRLERMGHDVEITCDGQQCYDRFVENSAGFQFILMDLDMPLVDGYVATEMIREFEKANPHLLSPPARTFGRTPIFAVSASLKPSHLPQILGSGFDGWVIKPVNFKMLALYLLGAFSAEARAEVAYDPENFLAGGWFT